MNAPLSIITLPESNALTVTNWRDAQSPAQQIRAAFRADPIGKILGIGFGSFIPTCSWFYCHRELMGVPMLSDARWLIVLAALIFSGISVAKWGAVAFSNGGSVTLAGGVKALAFTALSESVMLTAQMWELSVAALAILVTVNIVSCVTALQATPSASTPVTPSPAPSVTVNFSNQQNIVPPSRPKTAAQRAKEYRARKRNATITQTN